MTIKFWWATLTRRSYQTQSPTARRRVGPSIAYSPSLIVGTAMPVCKNEKEMIDAIRADPGPNSIQFGPSWTDKKIDALRKEAVRKRKKPRT